jgi:hypothetical protein
MICLLHRQNDFKVSKLQDYKIYEIIAKNLSMSFLHKKGVELSLLT